jgi:hypothetical protein
MKKGLVVVIVSFFLLTSWSLVLGAEMAKEGESAYKVAMSVTYQTLPMEKERVEMQYEVFAVTVETKENSPLYKSTSYALGEVHTYKGAYEERGFIRFTRPDGDQIFATFEAKGNVGGERKVKSTFVGGTGKCAGITGGMESIGVGGLRPPKEGVIMALSDGKYSWKIP